MSRERPVIDIHGKDKRAYQRWLKQAEQIKQATAVTATETEKEQEARKQKLLKDPARFLNYYFPTLQEPPDWMRRAMKRVLKDPQFFGWFMWARGLGKTSLLRTVLPMLLMARGELNFMILIAANERSACRQLGNLQAQLQANQRYVQDFGTQMQFGSWAEGEFQTRAGQYFLALGMQQPVRGANVDFMRPDYILTSDVETKERTKNPTRCQEAYNWLMEDVLGTQPTGGTTARFIFDNNYFSKTSIGQLIKDNNPGIEIIRQDLLDKDNRPVAPWITHNWVQQRRERIGYRAFMREYMNTPIEEGNVFRPEWVQWKRARPLSEYRKIVAYFDPSFSSRQTADYKAVRVWGLYKDELHCLDSFVRQCTIIDAVQWLYDYYSKAGQAAPVECWMERQFYNDPFQQAVISEGKRRGYRLPLKLDERKKANKKERIEAMAGMYEQGVVFWDARKREQADMQAAYDQLLAFGPGSQAHDDAPDADEGAWAVLLAYARQEAGGLKLGQRRGVMDY